VTLNAADTVITERCHNVLQPVNRLHIACRWSWYAQYGRCSVVWQTIEPSQESGDAFSRRSNERVRDNLPGWIQHDIGTECSTIRQLNRMEMKPLHATFIGTATATVWYWQRKNGTAPYFSHCSQYHFFDYSLYSATSNGDGNCQEKIPHHLQWTGFCQLDLIGFYFHYFRSL